MNDILVLAYDDTASDLPYFSQASKTNTTDAFHVALELLTKHDHVCIVEEKDYIIHGADYFEIAPYAINISTGVYVKADKYH